MGPHLEMLDFKSKQIIYVLGKIAVSVSPHWVSSSPT